MFAGAVSSALQLDATDQVVAYSLDEGRGTVAADGSGNARNGAISGATWIADGRYGAALSFDGGDDVVTGPTVTLNPPFTMAAWIFGTSTTPYGTVMSVGQDRDLFVRGGTLAFFANGREFTLGSGIPSGEWQHVAVTYDGFRLRAYINGALRDARRASLGAATGAMLLGAWNSGTGDADFWTGFIDEARIYDRALTAGEIQSVMNTPIGPAQTLDTTPPVRSNGQPAGTQSASTTGTSLSLVTDERATCRYSTTAGTAYSQMQATFAVTGDMAHSSGISGLNPASYAFYVRCQDAFGNVNTTDFTIAFTIAGASAAAPAGAVAAYGLDEGSGTLVSDGSGQGNNGRVIGATWTQGRYGGGLRFDGIDSRVSGPVVTLGPAFTMMAWVNNTSNAPYETVITVGSNRDLFLSSGVMTLFANGQELAFAPAVPNNGWQHLAVTYDGTSLRAYVNGLLWGVPVAIRLDPISDALQLGSWNSGTSNTDFWQGSLDEVRVYNRSLTASEIQVDLSSPITTAGSSVDNTPPTVFLSSPASGSIVSGMVTLSANASDDRGIVGVQFLVDGATLGTEDATAPYSTMWDSRTATAGNHTLQAVARDAAGNSATASTTVTVTTGGTGSSGAGGYALRFTGTGSNVNRVDISLDAPARPIDVGGDFTLEFWLKVEAGAVHSAACQSGHDGWIWGDIVLDRDIYWAGDYGDFGVSLSANGLAFGVADANGGGGVCGRTNLADGTWRHVAVTRRASDGRLQIYVDGRLDASGSGPAGNVSYRDGRSTQYSRDPFLVIGAEKHNVIPPMLTGVLDEIRISSIIRYTGDFQVPTQPFTTDSSTVGLYHLDEGQGDTIGDSSAAVGGPSNGTRRSGGTPAGPQWVTDTPFR